MKLLDTESPAGRAVELAAYLVKQGRMSKAEARVIEDLVWHPDMPESLRQANRDSFDLDAFAGIDDATGKPLTMRELGWREDGTFNYANGFTGRLRASGSLSPRT
ncbi:hypothetical protein AB6806_27420 [Bosea sp. RCC_152_1]|uniref:hypothetical protein n=1 Tax=Bosea sp. RCC_152_1 TaxID=3239228 RepID=UPI0035235824